ncbi:MAG: hypothetical protein K0V04_30050 [Deltaproteobacteria bacterium]|nr:hypothetical protein [Deltaproteobacteria bacterium]
MDLSDPGMAINVAAFIGAGLIILGLYWAWNALIDLAKNPSVSFSRHWGGLGSGQSGWDVSGRALSELLRLVLAVGLIALGAGLLWPDGDALRSKAEADAAAKAAAKAGDAGVNPAATGGT